MLHAQRSRSQAQNREQARARLVELVRGALTERTPRRATAPTRGSRERTSTPNATAAPANKPAAASARPDDDPIRSENQPRREAAGVGCGEIKRSRAAHYKLQRHDLVASPTASHSPQPTPRRLS